MCSFYSLCTADPRTAEDNVMIMYYRKEIKPSLCVTTFLGLMANQWPKALLFHAALFFIPLLTVALYNCNIVDAEMTSDVVQSTPAFPRDGQTGAPMGRVDDPSRANQRHGRRRGSAPASITSCTNSWSLANLKKCRPGQRRKAALGL